MRVPVPRVSAWIKDPGGLIRSAVEDSLRIFLSNGKEGRLSRLHQVRLDLNTAAAREGSQESADFPCKDCLPLLDHPVAAFVMLHRGMSVHRALLTR